MKAKDKVKALANGCQIETHIIISTTGQHKVTTKESTRRAGNTMETGSTMETSGTMKNKQHNGEQGYNRKPQEYITSADNEELNDEDTCHPTQSPQFWQ